MLKNKIFQLALPILVLACSLSACRVEIVKIKTADGRVERRYQQLRKTKVEHGFYRLYHENGKLSLEMFYKNGKLQGEEKSYYPNGQLHSIASLEAGSYEGPFKYWFATGVLLQEGTYINNNIEGELKTYYPNGVLKEIVSFSGSVENGAYTMYHQNGKLKEEGYFYNGPYPDGTIKQYNDEGLLIRKQQCEKGACEIIWELNPVEKKDD